MNRLVKSHDASRARFLRADFRGQRTPVRPPWAIAEAAFVESCNRCGDCASRCSQGIIVAGPGGYPKIDFNRGECTFCGDCLQACRTGALLESTDSTPWHLLAVLDQDKCIAFRGVVCRACGEKCQVGAIRFRLAVGGYALPAIDSNLCNGCGGCIRPCPTQAANVVHVAVQ